MWLEDVIASSSSINYFMYPTDHTSLQQLAPPRDSLAAGFARASFKVTFGTLDPEQHGQPVPFPLLTNASLHKISSQQSHEDHKL